MNMGIVASKLWDLTQGKRMYGTVSREHSWPTKWKILGFKHCRSIILSWVISWVLLAALLGGFGYVLYSKSMVPFVLLIPLAFLAGLLWTAGRTDGWVMHPGFKKGFGKFPESETWAYQLAADKADTTLLPHFVLFRKAHNRLKPKRNSFMVVALGADFDQKVWKIDTYGGVWSMPCD